MTMVYVFRLYIDIYNDIYISFCFVVHSVAFMHSMPAFCLRAPYSPLLCPSAFSHFLSRPFPRLLAMPLR